MLQHRGQSPQLQGIINLDLGIFGSVARAGAGWMKPHRDALFAVDDCLPVEASGGGHLRLLPGAHAGIHQGSDYLVLS